VLEQFNVCSKIVTYTISVNQMRARSHPLYMWLKIRLIVFAIGFALFSPSVLLCFLMAWSEKRSNKKVSSIDTLLELYLYNSAFHVIHIGGFRDSGRG